jgi:hypothetical protein
MSRRIAHARHMTGSATSGREASRCPGARPLFTLPWRGRVKNAALFNSIFSIPSRTLWNTGSPAFAGDDGTGVVRLHSSNTTSHSHRALRPSCCLKPSPKEGVALPLRRERALPQAGSGECRVPVAPVAACALVESTRVSHHEFTGITRHSRTRWFYSLLRALLGDRACLPPSPAESLPPT